MCLLVDGRANIAAALRGLLKLASKYQMENLRNTFIQKLQMEWPTTLVAWDALNKENSIYFVGEIRDDHYSSIILIIGLANSCDVSSILPTAFYWLFSLFKRYGYRHDKILPLLAHEDIQRLVIGAEAINKFLLNAYSEMGIDGWLCQDSNSPCGACRVEITLWWAGLFGDLAVQGPLELLKFVIGEVKPGSGLSFPIGNQCQKALAERLDLLRRQIFGNLRLYFDLSVT
jgi:hypothetical protein